MLDLEQLKLLIRRAEQGPFKFQRHRFHNFDLQEYASLYSGHTRVGSFYGDGNSGELVCYLLQHLDEIVDKFSIGAPDCHSDILSAETKGIESQGYASASSCADRTQVYDYKNATPNLEHPIHKEHFGHQS